MTTGPDAWYRSSLGAFEVPDLYRPIQQQLVANANAGADPARAVAFVQTPARPRPEDLNQVQRMTNRLNAAALDRIAWRTRDELAEACRILEEPETGPLPSWWERLWVALLRWLARCLA